MIPSISNVSAEHHQVSSGYSQAARVVSFPSAVVSLVRPELVQLLPVELLHPLPYEYGRIVRRVSNTLQTSIKLPRFTPRQRIYSRRLDLLFVSSGPCQCTSCLGSCFHSCPANTNGSFIVSAKQYTRQSSCFGLPQGNGFMLVPWTCGSSCAV